MAPDATGTHPVLDVPTDQQRLDLYRYVTADNAPEYMALMHLFTETLLTDLSAAEAQDLLDRDGFILDVDEVEARCRQLVAWGNLVPSLRDARVATVSEWLRSRSRYQVTKLGGRVHRDVDAILRASDGAREVARELLGGTVQTVQRILDNLAGAGDVDALAADVTTVFSNQRLFSDSATDFYAFVQGRLSRYDLGLPEYRAFKEMLLDYVDLLTADVTRHAPAVAGLLEQIEPHLPDLIATLDALPRLIDPDGNPAERSPGRSRADWDDLTAWYTGRRGRSGPDRLRNAAEQALGQLIANAKRMLSAPGTGVSRRADLLRLATWFDGTDTTGCKRLFDAAFGAYPSRHLLHGPEEDDGRAGPTTSWWDTEPVDVPLSLRERGDRSARGRSSRVPDPALDRETLLAEAAAEAAQKKAAAAELAASGNLHGARLTPVARDLLLERLGDLLAIHQDLEETMTSTDTDIDLVIVAAPSADATVIHCDDGLLTIHDLAVDATTTGQRASANRDPADVVEGAS